LRKIGKFKERDRLNFSPNKRRLRKNRRDVNMRSSKRCKRTERLSPKDKKNNTNERSNSLKER